MRVAKIASPLFILRDECSKDLMGTLEKLAEIGFDGVEFLGFFGHAPEKIRGKLDSIGLRAIGNHVPFDEFSKDAEKVVAEHGVLGCGFVTIAAPDSKGMPDGEDYPQTLRTMQGIGAMMRGAGMKLLFHNHASELKTASNGKSLLENLLDDCPPDSLYFEPDLGWIKIGGGDPAHYLKKYAARCPAIHFKDFIPDEKSGPGNFKFRPTGYGSMNNAELYRMALGCDPEWLVMDHDDAYGRDAFDDLKLSLEYFKNLIKITAAS